MIAKLLNKVTKHITPSPSGRKGWSLMGTSILSGLVLVSCVDTVILPDDKTVEEDFWQTKEDVNMMVNGAYSAISGSALQEKLIVWTMRSDELNFNTALNNNNLNQIYSANIQTTNTYNDWSELYSVINRCNLVIDKSASVMDIDPNYLEGDHLNNVAQMKALRALSYFYLVRVFRDVPLILEPYKNSSQEMNVPQEAPGRVIDQIIADLEEVKDHTLSSQGINDWKRTGYITRDGVYALLADVYLWKASVYGDESCYDKCIKCCDAIRANRMRSSFGSMDGFGSGTQLDDDGYGLNPSYEYYNVFKSTGNDTESLFELYNPDNISLRRLYHKTANTTTALPVFFTSSVYGTIASGENSLFNHDNYKYDVRGFESIYSFNEASDEGYSIRKFVADEALVQVNKDPAAESKKTSRYDNYRQNWIVYRITDVMLMKAEALVQKALLQSKANAGLMDQMAAATTVEDSLALAQELYQVNQAISQCNVKAARLAQIVNLRALNKTSGLTQVIDSAKYVVSGAEYDGVDASAFIRTQLNAFIGFEATADELELFVMDERARELCFEGKRWFDMLRFNYRHVEDVNYDVILARQGAFAKNYDNMLKLISRKYTSGGGSGVIAKMPTEPYLYMPVEQSEMSVNPMLQQNPVYSDGDTMEKNY